MATYRVELSPEADADLAAIRPFVRGPILRALAELTHAAEVRTRNRKPLEEPLQELPEASWEVRVGDYRALYQLKPSADTNSPPTARVIRVIIKGRAQTRDALGKARKR